MCNQLTNPEEFYDGVVFLRRRPYTRMPAKMPRLTAFWVGPHR